MALEMFCHECGEDLEIDEGGGRCFCGELTITSLSKCSIKPVGYASQFDGTTFAPNHLLIASSEPLTSDMAFFLDDNGQPHIYQIDAP